MIMNYVAALSIVLMASTSGALALTGTGIAEGIQGDQTRISSSDAYGSIASGLDGQQTRSDPWQIAAYDDADTYPHCLGTSPRQKSAYSCDR